MRREVDTNAYVDMLRTVIDEGRDVTMLISGGSMAPFLVNQRDSIMFGKPDRALKRGDMVFYQRDTGQYVMHRIYKVNGDETYDIVGDNQTEIERGVRRDQIFGLVKKVQRKGKWLQPGDFWWNFFECRWIKWVPVRPYILKLYGWIRPAKENS